MRATDIKKKLELELKSKINQATADMAVSDAAMYKILTDKSKFAAAKA